MLTFDQDTCSPSEYDSTTVPFIVLASTMSSNFDSSSLWAKQPTRLDEQSRRTNTELALHIPLLTCSWYKKWIHPLKSTIPRHHVSNSVCAKHGTRMRIKRKHKNPSTWNSRIYRSTRMIRSLRRDSNPRPSDYKSDALPAMLHRRQDGRVASPS